MPRAALALSLILIGSVPALTQDPGGLLQQAPRRRSAETLRKQAGNTSDRYLVVMNDSATGARGPLSRARDTATSLAATTGPRVDRVLSRALNGFIARLSAEEADALSRDPRVEYVEQDVEIPAKTSRRSRGQ